MQLNNDDNVLIEHIINSTLTKNKDISIELVVRPECNQKCEYCYLHQHGKELYPNRASKSQIINNTNLLINYFIKQDYLIKRIDLFAGDMFYDDLFFDIIDIVYKYYKWVYDIHPEFIQWHNAKTENKHNPAIVVPCNMSFCKDDNKIEKVKYYYNLLKEIGVTLYFSYSTDGKYATDIREHEEVPDEFFHKVFKFCEEMDWGVHPMVSYESIDNIIDNYEWFKAVFRQYRLNNGSGLPYFLEVRNDGWNEESLKKYQNFLQHHINDIFHFDCKSDIKAFFNNHLRIFDKTDENGGYKFNADENRLYNFVITTANFIPCALGLLNLCVNIGDLSIIPCHRTAYPELRGGTFKIFNNEIIGIEASEFYNAYLNLIYYNNNFRPGCTSCDYRTFCLKGCLGAQYEKFGDPNIPVPSVCSLFKTKLNTLFEYYHSIGLFHWLFTTEPNYPCNTEFQNLLLKLNYFEYENYNNLGEYRNYKNLGETNNDNRNLEATYGITCGS